MSGRLFCNIFLLTLVKRSSQESTFLNSVHEAINYNSECHIHIVLQEPFYYPLHIKNPSTIRLLTTSVSDNHKSLYSKNSSISVLHVRGIKCIYLIAIQTRKVSIVDVRFEFFPLYAIHQQFLNHKSVDLKFDINKMTYTVIFLTITSSDLLQFLKEFTWFSLHVRFYWKNGYVLISDSDFYDVGSNGSKNITHLTCIECSINSKYVISNANFELKSLRKFANYITKVNERSYGIIEIYQIYPFLEMVKKTKELHPIVVSKIATESAFGTDYLRTKLDIYMLRSLLEFRNFTFDSDASKYHQLVYISKTEDDFIVSSIKYGEVLFFDQLVHSFLTCYSKPVISLQFFVSPFQPVLWVWFILSAFSITLFWFKIKRLVFRLNSNSFSPILLVVSSFTDDSFQIPKLLRKCMAFRVSFVGWFLAMTVIVNGYIGVLICGLTTPFDLESIQFFENISIQHYNYQQINEGNLWCTMSEKLKYLDSSFSDGNPIEVREFNPEKDFYILTSAHSHTTIFKYKGPPCTRSKIKREIPSFIEKMIEAIKSACFNKPYLAKKKIEKSTTTKRLEELLFNLLIPSHNGIPESAVSLVIPAKLNKTCLLSDNNKYELEVEKELLKCERMVYVDEHSRILLEYEYLKMQYPDVTFFVSQQIWPQQRYWEFPANERRPTIVQDMKSLFLMEYISEH